MPIITRNFGCLTLKVKSLRSLRTSGTTTPPMKLISNKTGVFSFTLCAMLNIRASDLFFYDTSTRSGVMASPYGASRSQSMDTAHSVGLLRTRHQSDAEASTWKILKAHKRQTYTPPAGFESRIPEIEGTQNPQLRPRGHWVRLKHW